MTSSVLYSAYSRSTIDTHTPDFEQFEELHMHNLDDKQPTRPGFEPSTSEFRATIGPNEPPGPARVLSDMASHQSTGKPSHIPLTDGNNIFWKPYCVRTREIYTRILDFGNNVLYIALTP